MVRNDIKKQLSDSPLVEDFNAFYPKIDSIRIAEVNDSIVSCTIDIDIEARWDWSGK